MKKIIAGVGVLAFLASCGGPDIETPEQALLQSQNEIIKNYSKLVQATPEQSNSQGSMNLEISADQGTINAQAQYNFDSNSTTGETSGNMNISVDAESKQDLGFGFNTVGGNIDFDLIALKNKVFFKLNTLEISQPENNPMLEAYISMVSPYLEKWYFFEDTYSTMTESPVDMLKVQKDILEILKEQSLFSHVNTHENSEYYDYDVDINADTIIQIVKEIDASFGTNQENQITQSDIDMIRNDIQHLNSTVNMNIKISQNDLETFIFTANNQDTNFVIENNQDNIIVKISDPTNSHQINLNAQKNEKSISGNIAALENENEIFSADFNMISDLKNTEFSLKGTATDNNETMDFSFNLADKTEEKSVEISEPTDARNFQEVIMEYMSAMMGGAQMQIDMSEEMDTTISE